MVGFITNYVAWRKCEAMGYPYGSKAIFFWETTMWYRSTLI